METLLIRSMARVCNFKNAFKKAIIVLLAIAVSVLMFFSILLADIPSTRIAPVIGDTSSREMFKTKYNATFRVVSWVPQIMLWTGVFGTTPEDWRNGSQNGLDDSCKFKCNYVVDKEEVVSSDAVLFHLNDFPRPISKSFLPQQRRPDQLWVLFNMEALTNLNRDLEALNGLFNLTMTYHTNSELRAPYGAFVALNFEERKHNLRTLAKKDFFENKTHFALTMVSNCRDFMERLQVISDLKQYMPIDAVGDCFKNVTALDITTLSSYKFYIAFENSQCKEYVTEKYWNAIIREQVPIVSWVTPMDHIVPPRSYINIRDFDNLQMASKYIIRVGENQTLYNSYFDWKKDYKLHSLNPGCKLCEMLNNSTLIRQTYDRMDKWYEDDTCSSKNWLDELKLTLMKPLDKVTEWLS